MKDSFLVTGQCFFYVADEDLKREQRMGKRLDSLRRFIEVKSQEILLDLRYRVRDIRETKYARRHRIPGLSLKEKKAINDYWKKYGIRFRNFSWFQRYYYVTGKKDPRFLPYPFLGLIAYPYYNDLSKAKAWADKNEFARFLPQMSFPVMLGKRINSKLYDSERRYYGTRISDAFSEAIYREIKERGLDSVILKQTIDTNSGHGVRKYHLTSIGDIHKMLSDNEIPNFIIQEPIQQHEFFKQFNDSSVNIIRMNTWRTGDKVIIFSPCIRFGLNGSATDISYVDGQEIILAAGINQDGTVQDHYWSNKNEKKPLNIKDRIVPQWDELCMCVKTCHSFLDYFDVIAWDMTIDNNNKIICVEYNIQQPGSIVYQYIHGPFLGEHTDEFLSFLTGRDNRRKLVPRCIRL